MWHTNIKIVAPGGDTSAYPTRTHFAFTGRGELADARGL